MNKLSILLTGSTGMVGEGILQVCLSDPSVERIVVINRRPCGVRDPKLTEIIHQDFHNLSDVEDRLTGLNTCLFCLGVSSVGMKKDAYERVTYDLTMHFGKTLARLNQGMRFSYISGAGTDTTEKARLHWARVKGRTENDLMKLDFRDVFTFRPGFIKPFPGLKRVNKYYKYIGWLYPVGRAIYSKGFCTMRELGAAMLEVSQNGSPKKILEGKDIIALAARRSGGNH